MTAALRAADPDAPVASCPGWTVRALAGHVTGVHRWATAALGSDERPAQDETPAAGGADACADAYAEAGQALLAALRALPADAPAWTFDRGDRTAAFWRRRQLHEVAVHRWDVSGAVLDEAVAEDGVDEVLSLMLPLQVRVGRAVLPAGTLVLESPSRRWTVGDGEPAETVRGSAGDLLLALWGRLPLLPAPWGGAHLTP